MYIAIFTTENHNPLIKFLNLIFRGRKKIIYMWIQFLPGNLFDPEVNV